MRRGEARVEGGALGFAQGGEYRVGNGVVMRNVVERLAVANKGDEGFRGGGHGGRVVVVVEAGWREGDPGVC